MLHPQFLPTYPQYVEDLTVHEIIVINKFNSTTKLNVYKIKSINKQFYEHNNRYKLISDVGVGDKKMYDVVFSLSLSCRKSSFTKPPLLPLIPVRLIKSFSRNFISFISICFLYSLIDKNITAPSSSDPIRILNEINT